MPVPVIITPAASPSKEGRKNTRYETDKIRHASTIAFFFVALE
jgi:hypothetical protein